MSCSGGGGNARNKHDLHHLNARGTPVAQNVAKRSQEKEQYAR